MTISELANVDMAIEIAMRGRSENLRGLYPMAALVLAEEVMDLREQLRTAKGPTEDEAARRRAVMDEAAKAMTRTAGGLILCDAKYVIDLIADGKVPHVSIEY